MEEKMKFFKGVIVLFFCFLFSFNSYAAKDELKLESVTITANKIEENVQDVSISTSVFNEDNLEDLKVDSLSELADYVPNFVVFENGISGANTPIMRGMYADIETFTVSTGLYIDGVPALMGFGYDSDLSDIERVEVLRASQGTLYGKNAQAGVINIITKQPDNEYRGKISTEFGVDDYSKIALNCSAPLKKDKVYFGVSALHQQRKGWVQDSVTGDTIDDVRHFSGSGKIRWTPTDKLDIVFQASRKKFNDEQPHMNRGPATGDVKNRKVALDHIGYNNGSDTSQSIKIDYELTKNLKLTSITSNRVYNDDSSGDYDFTPTVLYKIFKDNNYRKKAQELRLASSGNGIKWVAGVYGDIDRDTQDAEFVGMLKLDNEIEGYSYSAFSHITIPFGEKFRFLAGLRYDYQERDFKSTRKMGGKSYSVSYDDVWTEMSPKAGIEFDLTENNLIYLTASKGYLSGGFNPFVYDSEYQSYDEETLWSYELGSKNTFLDEKIVFNAAVYYMDIENLQVQEVINQGESYTTNSPEATAYGVEFDLSLKPLKGLNLTASYGFNNIEFDDFKDFEGDYTDNKKPYAPEYTFSFAAKYRSEAGLYAGADLTGCGKMYTDKINKYKRDAFSLMNLKLGYETEKYDVYLFGKNIFDEEYDSDDAKGLYTFYSRPAEFGIAFTYRL